ncbi:MAG: hypothetical protein ACOC7L_02375 [Acidobacteriota bacterium]
MSGFLRSGVLSRSDGPGGTGWAGRAVGVAATLLVAYGSLSLFTLTARSPLDVAVEQACALGGWEEGQVHLNDGEYDYRFFFSDVRAELLVDTPEGRRAVEIRLRNDPISGWTVRSLTGDPVDPGVRLTSTF